MTSCTNAQAFDTFWDAKVGCEGFIAVGTEVTQDKKCIVNRNMTTFVCEEVAEDEFLAMGDVSNLETALTTAERKTVCQMYGALYGERDASLWTSNDTNCIAETDCTVADFQNTAITDKIDSGTSFDSKFLALCPEMRYIANNTSVRCAGDAPNEKCAADETAPSCEFVTLSASSIDGQIANCTDGNNWTIYDTNVCTINNNLSTPACMEQAEDAKIDANTIVLAADGAAGNNTRCVVLQAEYQQFNGTKTKGWIADGTTCAEVDNCTEIDFTDSSESGLLDTPLFADTVCVSLIDNEGDCTGDATATVCKKDEGGGVPGGESACAGVTGQTTLIEAITACDTAADTDNDSAMDCRVQVDISNIAAGIGCEEVAVTTGSMKAEDVTVADDAASDALCAYMGFKYGDDNLDAWKRTGAKCEAIVLEGSCDSVKWTEVGVDLGTFSDWKTLCAGVGHVGYTDEDGTEGNVTCKFDEAATPAPTTCSSALALAIGAMTAFGTLFM